MTEPLSLFEEAVLAALHANDGARERWDRRRQLGCSDSGMRIALAQELEPADWRKAPGGLVVTYAGRPIPTVWVKVALDRPPIETISGLDLIALARRLLDLHPLPTVESAQLKLL